MLKRIMEGSNWQHEQGRLVRFMSMLLARRSARVQRATEHSTDHVVYLDVEPCDLLLEPNSAEDDVLRVLLAPIEQCFGAWELKSVVTENKEFGVGDWAICDDEHGASWIIQVIRMLQVSLRNDRVAGLTPSDVEESDSSVLEYSIVLHALKYVYDISTIEGGHGALCLAKVSNLVTALIT